MRQNDLYEQKRRWQRIFLFFFLLFLTGVLIPGGCASEGKKSQSGKKGDPRDPSAQVLQTEASGEVTYGNDLVVLDASHTADGYVMICYNGSNEKVKLQVTSPDGTEYTYPVTVVGDYAVYPLPGGNGSYKVSGITDGCSLTAVCLEEAFCFQKLVSFADGHGVDTEIGCHLADGRKRFPRLKFPSPDSFDNLVAQLKVDRDFGLHVDLDDHISASPFCEI